MSALIIAVVVVLAALGARCAWRRQGRGPVPRTLPLGDRPAHDRLAYPLDDRERRVLRDLEEER